MTRLTFMIVATLLITTGEAAARCSDHVGPIITKENGGVIGVVISRDRLARPPAWSPEDGEPPLSVARAVELALDWAEAEHSRSSPLEVRRIALKSANCDDTFPRIASGPAPWYYIIHIYPVRTRSRAPEAAILVVVLMDGAVIIPEQL